MTPIDNTTDHFGAIAILFQWSMALIVIGLAALGLYMVTLPDVGFNTKKIMLILYHKEFGMVDSPKSDTGMPATEDMSQPVIGKANISA